MSPAFEHLLYYGSMRRLTEEELARAVPLDPSQIRGLGPSLEALIAMLREDTVRVEEVLQQGLASPEHKAFLEKHRRT